MEWLNKPDKMEKRRHFLLRGEEEEYEEDVLGSQRNRGEEGRKEAVFFVRQQVVVSRFCMAHQESIVFS